MEEGIAKTVAQIEELKTDIKSMRESLKPQKAEIKKVEKEIAKLEKQARAEKQPKKKFELVQQIRKLRQNQEKIHGFRETCDKCN